VIVALWALRGRIGRGPLAAVLIYVGTLAPALGFFNVWFSVYSFVADHFQYVAIPAAAALAAANLTRATRRFAISLPSVGCGALLLMLVVLTFRQCRIYKDDETLWTAVLRHNPTSSQAMASLGVVRQKQGSVAAAFDLYRDALRTAPLNTAALNNLLQVAQLLGQLEEARAIYLAAAPIDPKDEQVPFQLGLPSTSLNRPADAIAYYAEARRLRPDYVEARNNLATLLLQQRRYAEAVAELSEAVRANPDIFEVRLQLAMALAAA